MSIYILGDIQGCYREMRRLLDKIGFNPEKDKLWAVGDLVNRGSDSLAVLRFFHRLGKRGQIVLGNHDLTLLAQAYGNFGHQNQHDTLKPILKAPDRDELIYWLRHQPLLFHHEKKQVTLLHAGLPPQWSLVQARAYAQEAEYILQHQPKQYFKHQIYGKTPLRWLPHLSSWARIRFIIASLTRLRHCDMAGNLVLKSHPHKQVIPWFQHPQRNTKKNLIIFGHWAMLGYHDQDGVYALDTGCLWGRKLTALRLKDKMPLQLSCPKTHDPMNFLKK